MRYDVITIGSATQDVFCAADAGVMTMHTSHGDEKEIYYPLGGKILIKQLRFDVGGGGTNAAVTFSKMGLKTAYLGKLGKDEPGYAVIRLLKEENITFIGAAGGQTGYSVILDNPGQDRTILAFKGANDELSYEEVHAEQLDTRYCYMSSMLGKSFDTIVKVAQLLRNRKTVIAYNPSSYQAKMGLRGLSQLLKNVNILVLNKEEAGLLAGEGTMFEMANRIRTAGPGTIAITDAQKGVFVMDEKVVIEARPTANMKVIETTGAGDAFGSGLVAGLALNKTLQESVRIGLLNAEHVITNTGQKNAKILTRAQAEEALKKDQRVLIERPITK